MNTGAADLAIVMPVYNEAAVVGGVIRDWIRVLMAQGCDFRYWVIDDGSTDATVDILTELAVVYPEVKIERQPNLGSRCRLPHGIPACARRGRSLDPADRFRWPMRSRVLC
ncbi:MAG: glycosyltransferase [Gammaproteobacteria bacterium]|nr:glycosyltransferase [Gammaproteobacteria bacterium]